MVEEPKRARGGSKLARSEVTTVRLDPKLRYLAELAARKQRRTLSSFIEWAIEDSLAKFPLKEGPDWLVSLGAEAEALWDVDVADRFVKLAFRYPELLTHDEQILWKLVRENGYLWRGRFHPVTKEWTWQIEESAFNFRRFREYWDKFLSVSLGEELASSLPDWPRTKASSGFEDMDDDIPF